VSWATQWRHPADRRASSGLHQRRW
jgi:hypothetical protein